jgi:hypothetical protein
MALLLHQQLAVYKKTLRRPKLHPSDRLFWICLSRLWAEWRQALIIVTPDTVLRWHRRRFRDQWAKLSRGRKVGRPSINAEIVALVRKMAAANPLWGAPRIHGELPKLRIDVAERTVSRLIPKRPAALPDLAHVPHEPCPGSSLDRLLHRSHRLVCGCSSSWSSSLTIAAVSCTSTSPSIPPRLGPLSRSWTTSRTTLALPTPARSRRHLRRLLPTTHEGYAYPRSPRLLEVRGRIRSPNA